MLRKIVIALALMLAGPAMAQTVLAPPSVRWAGQYIVPQAVQNIGYDSGTGLPCIVGSTATCLVPTSATFAPSGTQDVNITKVGGNAVTTTVPVSGTVAATQSGTWTVQPGNTANTTPWLASINDGTTTATVAASGTDAASNANAGLRTYSREMVYNGTTWDMRRGDVTGGAWVQGPAASGSAVTGKPVLVGGSDGTNVRALNVTTAGVLATTAVGNAASGATDTGAPVKVGAVYNSTLPTVTTGQRVDLQAGSRGSVHVELWGSDAATTASITASADSIANSTAAIATRSLGDVFNGTTWDRSRSIQGTDGTGLGVQAVEQAGASFSNITTATTTTVKSGTGTLHKIIVNTPVASATITIYNNTAASGTKIGTITIPSTITSESPFTIPYDLWFSTGLTIVTSGATDLTVIYR